AIGIDKQAAKTTVANGYIKARPANSFSQVSRGALCASASRLVQRINSCTEPPDGDQCGSTEDKEDPRGCQRTTCRARQCLNAECRVHGDKAWAGKLHAHVHDEQDKCQPQSFWPCEDV